MKYILLISIFLITFTLKGNPLSDEAKISILTCSPGTELYSLFGHTGIRVNDPATRTDIVFNYGTFDFNTPYFYLKYARGLLPYQLSITSFPNFLYAYQMDKRSVYSQTLQLDSLQKQHLFDLLLENHRPENRAYLYNFLFDNCTTRSRDVLTGSLTDTVSWNLQDDHKSFWNLLDEYLSASPWVQWGIHTILGQRGNREASTFEYMFLPDYLMYGLNTAHYQGQRLATDAEILYEAPANPTHYPWFREPLFVFGIATLLLTLLLVLSKNIYLFNFLAFLFFLFSGIIGCLIVFLGGFTAHPITAPNWNILWANPLNLLILPFTFTRSIPIWIRGYLKFYLATLTIAIPVWAIAQPAVPMASIFLIFFLIYLSFRFRKIKQKK